MFHRQKQKYCKQCQRMTLHVRDEIHHQTYLFHGFLSVMTCLLWLLPGAVIIGIQQNYFLRWRCQVCGGAN